MELRTAMSTFTQLLRERERERERETETETETETERQRFVLMVLYVNRDRKNC